MAVPCCCFFFTKIQLNNDVIAGVIYLPYLQSMNHTAVGYGY